MKILLRYGRDVVGWGSRICTSPEVKNNYFADGIFDLGENCTKPTITGNVFYTTFAKSAQFPNNTYYTVEPSVNSIFVRPNRYQQGRANVIIYNWVKASSVLVDLGSVLKVGQNYEIRDAQNVNGPAILTGSYDGNPISIPITSTAVSRVYGTVSKQPTHSDREFGAFVVLPRP